MENKRLSVLIVSLLVTLSLSGKSKEPVDYVNPYMGNISILLQPTYPTVHLPNSLMRIYPMRGDFTGDRLEALPVIVTTHRETSAFSISPYSGKLTPGKSYSYDLEKVSPYRYSVYLDEDGIAVDYAPSHQSAIYSFEFEKRDSASIVISAKNGVLESKGSEVFGYQTVGNSDTKIYIYAETSASPKEVRNTGGSVILSFCPGTRNVRLRYGVSYIDIQQAKSNLMREIAGFDVEKVAAEGRRIWNDALGKIMVEGSDENAKTIFYTSLYRTYERMICMDEGGRYYSPYDGKVHSSGSHKFYNDDWIWDTYRAVHPLRLVIERKAEEDMLDSYVTMAEQMGDSTGDYWMPTFPEAVGDSRRMNCNHAIAAVADAYAKGLRDIDFEKAYKYSEAGIKEKTLIPWSSARGGELDKFFWKNGFFPALEPGEKETVTEVNDWEKRQPVAVTLGTSYDLWCLSKVAEDLGYKADYQELSKESLWYRNIFNPQTGFFHPKDSLGRFIEPMDYSRGGGIGAREYYGENNGWEYRWDVQHNISDLIALMGGPSKFAAELDRMFDEPIGCSKFVFFSSMPDHTGNVGQFSMGNETGLHVPYLYCYAGEAWKTQKRVRALLDEWFRNDLMGLPGDEDGGGMSAFVVFSQLGFYPVTPGLPMYVIGSPVFETASIQLENGKHFEIVCHNYSPENKYIAKAVFNGKDYDKCWFTHDQLMKGGTLEFYMSSRPVKTWSAGNVPPSFDMK
jgi:predicted alpha-1,2-mannosidase